MTKAEQVRIVAWRLRILRHAGQEPRYVAETCRHFGISRTAFYRWKKRYDKKSGMVIYRSRLHGTLKRNYQLMPVLSNEF